MNKKLQHIVCVDDERDILEITRLCLETIGGYQVTVFSSGLAALQRIPALAPDLILMDGMMPDLSGAETLVALRGLTGAVAQTPVIFMTACAQPAEVKAYMDLGAIGVIIKPFDPMKLAGEVTDIWSGYPGSSEADMPESQ